MIHSARASETVSRGPVSAAAVFAEPSVHFPSHLRSSGGCRLGRVAGKLANSRAGCRLREKRWPRPRRTRRCFSSSILIPAPAPAIASTTATYDTRLLLLPTGLVMLSALSDTALSKCKSTRPPAARTLPGGRTSPMCRGILHPGRTYRLHGRQLNGLSQGLRLWRRPATIAAMPAGPGIRSISAPARQGCKAKRNHGMRPTRFGAEDRVAGGNRCRRYIACSICSGTGVGRAIQSPGFTFYQDGTGQKIAEAVARLLAGGRSV